MAQTKIWKIDNHLAKCIRYIMNPAKTQDGKLVSGVNLLVPQNDWKTPTQQMNDTKARFGKQGGRLAYHMEQSFLPGEVSPETAHKIGVELARELFGEKYEVVVATHTDKEHIHTHFILNSVSFVDGRKFHQPNAVYYDRIRKVSDRLCEKYGLSIIKEAKQSRYESYPAQHHQEPQPAPTVHSIMYQDIDRAIDSAKDLAKLDRYSQEARLLVQNKIRTGKELSAYRVSLDERIHELHKERWYLKRDLQKGPTEEERQVTDQKIAEINQRLKPLYRERSLCKDIAERCSSVTAAVNREKEVARHELERKRGDDLSTTHQRQ